MPRVQGRPSCKTLADLLFCALPELVLATWDCSSCNQGVATMDTFLSCWRCLTGGVLRLQDTSCLQVLYKKYRTLATKHQSSHYHCLILCESPYVSP